MGDINTSYFHRQFRSRLSQNHISEIVSVEGTVFKGYEQIKGATKIHFQKLFRDDGIGSEEVTLDLLSYIPSLVSSKGNKSLLNPYTEEEINKVIWSMDPDKAPGPDGFLIQFYRIYWTIIKSDLVRMIKSFQHKAKVGGNTNSTFLALIPKEVKPGSFDHFRPICLCNASYKIITKLLEKKIKSLLEKIISPS